MRRGPKPAKSKEAKPPVTRESPKSDVAKVRDLEERLAEAQEQQTATSEILRAISGSPTDVQPVFDAIVRNAVRLCGGVFSIVLRFDGELIHFVAHHNFSADALTAYRQWFPCRATDDHLVGRAIIEQRIMNVPDVTAEFRFVPGQREQGFHSVLFVPMLRDGVSIGVIGVSRMEAGSFPENQVELLKTFADQAVIAIENVRLFNETKEALERQTATSEILRVISSSPTDLQPVLDAIAESAGRLCGAYDVIIVKKDGEVLRRVAHHGPIPGFRELSTPVIRGTVGGRAVLDRTTVHVADLQAEVSEFPEGSALAREHGFHTILSVPLLREGKAIGAIHLRRTEVKRFTDAQIALLQTFADQAVIAIENVRLFTELQSRNRDLTEALGQQTATSEILQVISSSPTDVQPVFDAIAASAARLCDGYFSQVSVSDGEHLHLRATHNLPPEWLKETAYPQPLTGHMQVARTLRERRVIHVLDMQEDGDVSPATRHRARLSGYRTWVGVPILLSGGGVGAIAVSRREKRPFSDREIALLKTFADQAVIAIENVRLFKELETRNRDLTEALEQQTATSDILRVISSSPTDLQPVLDALAESAAQLCEAYDSVIWRLAGDRLLLVAHHGTIPHGPIGEFTIPLVRGLANGRAVLDGRTVHVADMQAETDEFP